MECSHPNCDQEATHRYQWPNDSVQFACYVHLPHAREVSEVMGGMAEFEPLLPSSETPHTVEDRLAALEKRVHQLENVRPPVF